VSYPQLYCWFSQLKDRRLSHVVAINQPQRCRSFLKGASALKEIDKLKEDLQANAREICTFFD